MQRPRRRPRRRYRYKTKKPLGWKGTALLIALVLMAGYGAFFLIRYALSARASRQTEQSLRSAYYAVTEAPPPETPAVTSAPPTETAAALALPEEPETPAQTAAPATAAPPMRAFGASEKLKAQAYADNPQKQIASRFQTLRRTSPDTVGWLNVPGMLDEAVVQRDNVFFLDHDARGRSNINGALFLDAAISLDTRPYTLLIYGHNMRSGDKFGSLRKFENEGFYWQTPFITFDSLYEEGKYVVFAAGQISMDPGDARYVDFFAFSTLDVQERLQMIRQLSACSVYARCGGGRPAAGAGHLHRSGPGAPGGGRPPRAGGGKRGNPAPAGAVRPQKIKRQSPAQSINKPP